MAEKISDKRPLFHEAAPNCKRSKAQQDPAKPDGKAIP